LGALLLPLSLFLRKIMITVGTNSFVTLTEANTYMGDRFGGAAWFALTIPERETLLITAFRWLVSEGVPKTSTSEGVKWGQIELAWWINNYFDEYEARQALIAGGVKKFKASKWEEELSQVGLPQNVKNLVSDDMNLGGYFPTYSRQLEN
jgi:hypothetical protein